LFAMAYFPRRPPGNLARLWVEFRTIFFNKGQKTRIFASSIERLGYRLQRNFAFEENPSRHQTIQSLFDMKPHVGKGAFVAPTASIVGDVEIGAQSAVWYGVTLRAEMFQVQVGEQTNIGEQSVITGRTSIGNRVSIGGKTILQSCIIRNNVRIGPFSSVHENSILEEGAILLDNSRVYQGVTIPANQVWGGSPAEFIREVTDADRKVSAQLLVDELKLAKTHADENAKNNDLSAFARRLEQTNS